MNIDKFVVKMKNIQNALQEFLEDESDAESKYDDLINLITTHKIINEQYEFKALLRLINSIGKNHHRLPNFISKFERLLRYFKKDIKKYYSNQEIFQLFESNKRILLFLIEEKMIKIDEYIFSQITSNKHIDKNYFEYFFPEIKPFLTKENIKKYGNKNRLLEDENFIESINIEVDENFYKKRREGENDDYLCQLIRMNKITEFIIFVEQTNMSLESYIKKSIFETNQLFFRRYLDKVSLIEYASFYGSIDIIKYMEMKGVHLESNMWIYAIHSRNAELINHLFEENVCPPERKYHIILEESIKCHHNEISNFIIDNKSHFYYHTTIPIYDNKYDNNLYRYAVKYNNYYFFPSNMKYKYMFFYLCQFCNYPLVKLYLEEGNIDINAKIKISII